MQLLVSRGICRTLRTRGGNRAVCTAHHFAPWQGSSVARTGTRIATVHHMRSTAIVCRELVHGDEYKNYQLCWPEAMPMSTAQLCCALPPVCAAAYNTTLVCVAPADGSYYSYGCHYSYGQRRTAAAEASSPGRHHVAWTQLYSPRNSSRYPTSFSSLIPLCW